MAMKGSNKKWRELFVTNFLGVFNDNFLKNSIIFISVTWSLPTWLSQSQLISLVASCLVVPYLIFSPIGGSLAVKYSKLKVLRLLKLIEVPVMLLACVAFYKQWVLLAVLSVFALGTQSCLYSPSKYSLIRDIGGENGVSYGSGMFETMAFMGILIGTFIASLISDHYSLLLFASIGIGVALLGYFFARIIRAEELPVEMYGSSTINPYKFVKSNYKFASRFKLVNSAVFGSSAFWLIANMVQMNIIIHCKGYYQISNSLTGVVMACAAIGIALGTGFTGKMMGTKVVKGLIIPALIGIITVLLVIVFIPLSFKAFIVMVILFAFTAGMFQVPCMALMQQADLGRKRGDTVAYLNIMNFVFILIGTLVFSITTALTDENSFAVFGVMIVLCLFILIYFLVRYPDFRNETTFLLKRNE